MDQAMESVSVKDLDAEKNIRQIQVKLVQSWENWNQASKMYEIGLLFSDRQVVPYFTCSFLHSVPIWKRLSDYTMAIHCIN